MQSGFISLLMGNWFQVKLICIRIRNNICLPDKRLRNVNLVCDAFRWDALMSTFDNDNDNDDDDDNEMDINIDGFMQIYQSLNGLLLPKSKPKSKTLLSCLS
ncbi:hypothetical protein AWZ03_004830 [Drosophila navojoa]|uniref:Uncharacterized protein n=1 Tax=Drosophila navojoa TaxID=7232 RepID=A0A484BIZ9_DRONA|nr:hypothetical protein AWZ03_004830 [Drosophila navojoa]